MRPKLTHKAIEDICNVISIGGTQKIAANYVGVSETAFYDWRNKGEAALERLLADPTATLNPRERLYVQLVESLRKVKADAAAGWLQVIDTEAQRDPTWAAWQLRKWYPEYRDARALDVTTAGQPLQQGAMTVVLFRFGDEEFGDAKGGGEENDDDAVNAIAEPGNEE